MKTLCLILIFTPFFLRGQEIYFSPLTEIYPNIFKSEFKWVDRRIVFEPNDVTIVTLKYFLGDNQNAIEIQIWVSLIIQLIMLVIQRKAERNWAYSNMMSVIRYHLMTYIDLFKFLKNPDSKYEEITTKNIGQLSIFDP